MTDVYRPLIERPAAVPIKSTAHMSEDERFDGTRQMLANLHRLALADRCVAAGWAMEQLSMVPQPTLADDSKSIDFEWLASVAKKEMDQGYWDTPSSDEVWWEIGALSFTCESYQSDPGEPTELVATDWRVDGEDLPRKLVPKTRGELRRLAAMAGA